jgi:hypothetical protein
MVQKNAEGCRRLQEGPGGARLCLEMPESAGDLEGYRRIQEGTEELMKVQDGAGGCRRTQEDDEGYRKFRRVRKSTGECRWVQRRRVQRVQEGSGCEEGYRWVRRVREVKNIAGGKQKSK